MSTIQLRNNTDPYATVVNESTRAQNRAVSQNLQRYLEETANNNEPLFRRNETHPQRRLSDARFVGFVGQNGAIPIGNSQNQSPQVIRVSGHRLPSTSHTISSDNLTTNTHRGFDIRDLSHRVFVNNSVTKNITNQPIAIFVSVIVYLATAALTLIAVNYAIALYSGLEITKAILLNPVLASSISSAIVTVGLACCISGKSRIVLEQEARVEEERQAQQRLEERRERQRVELERRLQAQQNFDPNRLSNHLREQAQRDLQESIETDDRRRVQFASDSQLEDVRIISNRGRSEEGTCIIS